MTLNIGRLSFSKYEGKGIEGRYLRVVKDGYKCMWLGKVLSRKDKNGMAGWETCACKVDLRHVIESVINY